MEKIVVLATGGTIAGTAGNVADGVGYRAGELPVAGLLGQVAGLRELLGEHTLVTEQLAQINSKDLEPALWQTLALRCAGWMAQPDVRGLILTHGTDTLEETAWFLQRMLDVATGAGVLSAAQARKAVVLVSAMRPATARLADGPQNLADAVAVVQDVRASGVLAVAAGKVQSAREVQKVHPYRLDAFDGGDAGALGYVEEGRPRWIRQRAPVQALDILADAIPARNLWRRMQDAGTPWPWVEVLSSHAGASARAFAACREAGVHGIVLAGTGNASLHAELEKAAQVALDDGLPVWRTTRCHAGSAVAGGDSCVPLAMCRGEVLRPMQARTEMLLRLLAGSNLRS